MSDAVNSKETLKNLEKRLLLMLETGRLSDAVSKLEDLMPGNSQNPDFLKIAGAFYIRAGNFPRAYYLLKQAAYYGKEDREILSRLLYVCVKTGNLTEAEHISKKICDRNDLSSLVACGEYFLALADYPKAIDYARRAYKADSGSYEATFLLSRVLSMRNEMWQEAMEYLEKARKIKDDDEIDEMAVKILFKAGQYDSCMKLCKKILISKPNSLSAQRAQEIIGKIKQMKMEKPPSSPASSSSESGSYTDRQQGGKRSSPGDKNKTSSLEEAMEKLNQLTGLRNVKEQIEKLRKKIEYDQYRKEKLGIEQEKNPGYHFVFTGNPGTGKTTVARLLGDIFYHLGILEKGHLVETDRSGIVGEFIGQTAKLTKQKIEEAMGGVLFIDEAYALARAGHDSNDFGHEAIDTLIKEMEDKRGKFVVILAGYKDEMNQLLKMNPGFSSRINKKIDFPDYTDEELLEIAIKMAESRHYIMSEEAKKAFLIRINCERIDEKFGNARAVRNIMYEAFEEKANVDNLEMLSLEDLQILKAKDFGIDLEEDVEKSAEVYLEELNSLVGLKGVKEKINEIIKYIQYQKENERLGYEFKSPYMHMVFAGNPGTGKTTVALLFGKILKALGILKKGHMVTATRADLVSGYVGQTAMKTRDKIREAYGGILFIDEAYSLVQDVHGDFGREAVDTLIKEMEDSRDKLVVILAGYTDNMKELIDTNPGFRSRISCTIQFDDYTPEEMLEIFINLCKKEKYDISNELMTQLKQKFQFQYENRDKSFGNAREVRNLFENMKLKLAVRVQNSNVDDSERMLFKPCDLL